EGSIEVCDLGEHRLKDISEPQRLYQLGEEDFPPLRAPTKTSLPRQLTRFVGHERELEGLARLPPGAPLRTLAGGGGRGEPGRGPVGEEGGRARGRRGRGSAVSRRRAAS